MELELRPFDPKFASTIASWVLNDADLLWLAPKTLPPLTAEKILAWRTEHNTTHLLFAGGEHLPCGYSELNRMKVNAANLWLGHVIINPQCRGRGIGTRFVQILLHEAFESCGAQSVSLIVFPDNEPAIRCYLRCGFVVKRNEYHRFRRRGPKHRMLRLDLEWARWFDLAKAPTAQSVPAKAPILPIAPERL